MPKKVSFAWSTKLSSEGLGGIAADSRYVIAGGRDILDRKDVFSCLDASTGKEIWQVKYNAPFGEMDYGKTPRATPLIVGGRVVLLGAFGDLRCVDLTSGNVIWEINFVRDFDAKIPTWGFCGSPVMIDEECFAVQPGGKDASLVAIQVSDGSIKWKAPGREPGYSSFITAEVNGKKQLIGYDQISLGGWDIETGTRLWELKPEHEGDFNVPSPVMIGDRLFVCTENNGSRFYEFDSGGNIKPTPVAKHEDLSPDTHTPVRVDQRIVGVSDQLYSLDFDLKQQATDEHGSLMYYCSAISNGKDLALIVSAVGELLLYRVDPDLELVGHLKLSEDEFELNSHPAFVGTRFYFRKGRFLCCLDLKPMKKQDQRVSNQDTSDPMELKSLNAELSKYVENVVQRHETIPEGRREVLEQVAREVRNEIAEQGTARLTFICTHNSRRSHLAQVWAAVAAVHFGLKNIESYSGGTEVTACNERTVAAFRRAGFEVSVDDDGDGESANPVYKLRFDSTSEPIRCFSKIYNESPNPTESYFAMMCCGDVDERCPVVGGAKYRFSIHYVDPKVSDATDAESATYDERCLQIATEMFFLVAAISE